MSEALAKKEGASLKVESDWREMGDVIRAKYPNASDPELKLFFYQANRTGLDPLAGQIHLVSRWDSNKNKFVSTIQTAIDGFRVIADRSGSYAGVDDYKFNEGVLQYECIKAGLDHPEVASSTVYRIVQGVRVPFTASAQWDAYFPGEKQGFMWRKMPYLMLGKCAEALALRKAFPNDMSGIYTDEEMSQADKDRLTRAQVTGVEDKKAEVVEEKKEEEKPKELPPHLPDPEAIERLKASLEKCLNEKQVLGVRQKFRETCSPKAQVEGWDLCQARIHQIKEVQ